MHGICLGFSLPFSDFRSEKAGQWNKRASAKVGLRRAGRWEFNFYDTIPRHARIMHALALRAYLFFARIFPIAIFISYQGTGADKKAVNFGEFNIFLESRVLWLLFFSAIYGACICCERYSVKTYERRCAGTNLCWDYENSGNVS